MDREEGGREERVGWRPWRGCGSCGLAMAKSGAKCERQPQPRLRGQPRQPGSCGRPGPCRPGTAAWAAVNQGPSLKATADRLQVAWPRHETTEVLTRAYDESYHTSKTCGRTCAKLQRLLCAHVASRSPLSTDVPNMRPGSTQGMDRADEYRCNELRHDADQSRCHRPRRISAPPYKSSALRRIGYVIGGAGSQDGDEWWL